MKKIIASASLAAVGAVSLQAALEQGLTPAESAKPWNISATLRGFYDDNYDTRPTGQRLNSFGFEVSPTASANYVWAQNAASLSYTYRMRYYENRAHYHESSADHTHLINGSFEHSFSDQYKLDLSDAFVIAQEPELIDPSGSIRRRANGSNIRNTASARLRGDVTRLFGFELGYSNTFYDFDDPFYALLLNRMHHLAHLDLRWHALPQTWGILGYQFGLVDYTHSAEGVIDPEVRNNRSHYIYLGADHAMMGGKVNAYGRIGGQITDFYNADRVPGADETTASPYADFGATWAYMPGSFLQLGIRHSRLATDIFAFDQEATTLYGQVSQQITPKLTCNLTAQYQNASFNDSSQPNIDGKIENYYIAGVNLAYQIMTAPVAVAAETGYNLDVLDSQLSDRSYTRNRVYLGVRASY
ncbi:MAG: outer membrane beta-barrel protein [Candidatus Omnitrophica bacterium]|nr:outer membrane beta-barrel protein [Candidatus Omnitrophota bacterium]